MPNCHSCGAENSTRARFCQNCGVQVVNEISGDAFPPVATAAPDDRNIICNDDVNKSEGWTTRTADQLIDQVDRGVFGSVAVTEGTILELNLTTDWKSGGLSRGYQPKQVLEVIYRLDDGKVTAIQVDAVRGPVIFIEDRIRVQHRVKGGSSLVSSIENVSRGTFWKSRKWMV